MRAVKSLASYFTEKTKTCQDILQDVVCELQTAAVAVPIKRVKGRLTKSKLHIGQETDQKEAIRSLQAELEKELEAVERLRKYFEAMQEREQLTAKLQTVQGNIETLKTSDMEAVYRQRPHLMDQEERRKYREDEARKREETSEFARKLREEQHRRYLKQKAEFEALQQSIAEAQAAEHQRDQEKVELLRQEKEARLRSIHEKAEQRKEYLRNMRKHAEEVVPPLKQVRQLGSEGASHSADSRPFQARTRPSKYTASDHTSYPVSPVPAKKYALSPFLRKALKSEADNRAKALQTVVEKRNRAEKTKRYAEIVKEMFAPTVDLMKQKELELIKHKLGNPVIRKLDKERSRGEEEEEKKPRPRRKADKTDLKPVAPPKKPPVDYLARMHSERQSELNRLLHDHLPSIPDTSAEDPSQVRKLEKLAKRKEMMMKRLSPLESVEVEAGVNSLVVSSVKAKLALLDHLS